MKPDHTRPYLYTSIRNHIQTILYLYGTALSLTKFHITNTVTPHWFTLPILDNTGDNVTQPIDDSTQAPPYLTNNCTLLKLTLLNQYLTRPNERRPHLSVPLLDKT